MPPEVQESFLQLTGVLDEDLLGRESHLLHLPVGVEQLQTRHAYLERHRVLLQHLGLTLQEHVRTANEHPDLALLTLGLFSLALLANDL